MAELENPYPLAASAADALPVEAAAGTYEQGGVRVEAARGWGWIRDGFDYFRRQPGTWILLALIFGALLIGVSLIPMIGSVLTILLVPVLAAGLLAGCQTLESGGELELAHLFAGFRRHTGQLMLVGLIGFALTAAVMIPAALLIGGGGILAIMSGSASGAASGAALGAALGTAALVGALISLALFVFVNMAMWFAPALVMLQEHSAPHAVAESFRGCLKNILPFLLYSVILFLLAMVASIPLGLGWLVLAPVVFGSVYAAYRDIYFAR
ncbi:MAG TPA: BPSS1780 family membrane protein [Burkholderiales bacterium]|nr:BPSS1780 family membrane protein [Burkholderiales bacterium]